jgi:membrane fusion protein (multidrug efflux system)
MQGPVRVEGAVVKRDSIDHSIIVPGTLAPFDETVLMPDVQGRVVSINIQEGKPVVRGTLLVKLFDEDLQAQLRRSVAQRELAKQTLTRLSELLKVNGVSRTEYDQASLQVTSLEAEAEILNAQIRKTEVRAPFDGVLGLKRISVGAQVTPSTPLVTIRAVTRLKLDFSVPEKYALDMREGATITFTVSESDERFTATVLATEREIASDTRTLPVRAICSSESPLLVAGQFAKVVCRHGAEATALVIPTAAIIADERRKMVVVAKTGKAVFATIVTGVRRAADVEVVKGLSEGDTVATTGLLFVKPGMPLAFTRVK